jgi:hypothetical protein
VKGLYRAYDNQNNLVFTGGLPIKNTGYDVSYFTDSHAIAGGVATGLLVYVQKKIRFIVVPLVFVLLLAGILGTVGASAKTCCWQMWSPP